MNTTIFFREGLYHLLGRCRIVVLSLLPLNSYVAWRVFALFPLGKVFVIVEDNESPNTGSCNTLYSFVSGVADLRFKWRFGTR